MKHIASLDLVAYPSFWCICCFLLLCDMFALSPSLQCICHFLLVCNTFTTFSFNAMHLPLSNSIWCICCFLLLCKKFTIVSYYATHLPLSLYMQHTCQFLLICNMFTNFSLYATHLMHSPSIKTLDWLLYNVTHLLVSLPIMTFLSLFYDGHSLCQSSSTKSQTFCDCPKLQKCFIVTISIWHICCFLLPQKYDTNDLFWCFFAWSTVVNGVLHCLQSFWLWSLLWQLLCGLFIPFYYVQNKTFYIW